MCLFNFDSEFRYCGVELVVFISYEKFWDRYFDLMFFSCDAEVILGSFMLYSLILLINFVVEFCDWFSLMSIKFEFLTCIVYFSSIKILLLLLLLNAEFCFVLLHILNWLISRDFICDSYKLNIHEHAVLLCCVFVSLFWWENCHYSVAILSVVMVVMKMYTQVCVCVCAWVLQRCSIWIVYLCLCHKCCVFFKLELLTWIVPMFWFDRSKCCCCCSHLIN